MKSPVELRDSVIASIAIEHKLTLVTRNKKDYSKIPDLTVEEW